MARKRTRIGFGALMMIASLSVGVIAPLSAVAADGVPKTRVEAVKTKQAFWHADQSNYTANAATSQFPPQAVCLVQPAACFFPEGDPLGLGATLNSNMQVAEDAYLDYQNQVRDGDPGSQPDPVAEDQLPVSIAFGQINYRSAVRFDMPKVPTGHEIDTFYVVLAQGQPTYYNESPALRQAVSAALSCASDGNAPVIARCQTDSFEKIQNACESGATPGPCLQDGEPILVEACPIVGADSWEAGMSQDEDTIPDVNCFDGAQGQTFELEETTYWVFDLTYAAQSWTDGLYANDGVLFQPGAPDNFAYGDPEYTQSKQVTFSDAVQVAMVTEPLPSSSGSGGGVTTQSSNTGTSTTSTTSSGDVFSTPSSSTSTTTTTTSSSIGVPSGGFSQPVGASAPTVSQPATTTDVPAPATANAGEQVQTLAANSPLGQPQDPWWLWVALTLMFLGGAYLMARSLQEEAVLATSRSGGAMTRLLQRVAADRTPDLVTR